MRGDHVAIGALSFFREPFDEAGRIGHLAARLRHRFALFGGHDRRKVFGIGDDEVEPAAQDRGTVLGGSGCPGGHGLRGGLYGARGFGMAKTRHVRDHLPGRGIAHGDLCLAVHPLPSDQAAFFQQLRAL